MKWNLHDVLEIEAAVIEAEAKLRKAIANANRAALAAPCNDGCRAIHGSESDCRGTLQVNLNALTRRITMILEAL